MIALSIAVFIHLKIFRIHPKFIFEEFLNNITIFGALFIVSFSCLLGVNCMSLRYVASLLGKIYQGGFGN